MYSKICPNPACKTPFKTKNSKKRFCCLHCKNQAAYWYRQNVYAWEILMCNMRIKNIKILEHLVSQKIFKINRAELKVLGFDIECGYTPYSDLNEQVVYRFGNIYMVHVTKTEFNLELI